MKTVLLLIVGAVCFCSLFGFGGPVATNGVGRASLGALVVRPNSAVTATLLYKRVCSIHRCEYDIRYGGCPMCKAPDFGSGKPQYCPKCGCYINNRDNKCPRCGW